MKALSSPPPIIKDEVPHFSEAIPVAPPRTRRAVCELPANPRILFVTPEISSLGKKMGPGAEFIRAKAGGMAEVSASLVDQLHLHGSDIHLALPHYRNLFQGNGATIQHQALTEGTRIHLAEDSAFYRRLSAYHGDLHAASLAFQREVINHIIPAVKPDIVHCNDWMTGLIPAACKQFGIKTIFTIHNIHRERTTLAEIEGRDIDTSSFWPKLYYEDYPYTFEQSYHNNAIDLLCSAIINADYVTTVSPTFLQEIIHGTHGELPESVQWDLRTKVEAGYACGILNAPDISYDPAIDPHLAQPYTAETHHENKTYNKVVLQKQLGLTIDHETPLLFWPSRLDPIQKGCQLLTDILYDTMAAYHDVGLQLVIVADGPFKCHFETIVAMHGLQHRVAITDFDESISRLAFAAADFVLMPSSFEPCGLPQMIGMRYGTLPIVHNTGGLHDTVEHFDTDFTTGNGFVFDHFDANGLRWAIDRAVDFHRTPRDLRQRTITRVMREAHRRFDRDTMFSHYLEAYQLLSRDQASQEHLLARPA